MKLKLKIIRENNKIFLIRLTLYLKVKSIKIHLILNDDTGEPHTHPWSFKSFLIIPYKERVKLWIEGIGFIPNKNKGFISNNSNEDFYNIRFNIFNIVERSEKDIHQVSLYRICGIKIPALTIGIYSEKKQLCSLCQEAGYCKSNKK